jgi:hypothetical protein
MTVRMLAKIADCRSSSVAVSRIYKWLPLSLMGSQPVLDFLATTDVGRHLGTETN